MLPEHDDLISDGWIYRPSPKYQNHGIYYRYEHDECDTHGEVAYAVVYGAKKLTDRICRQCARERENERYTVHRDRHSVEF